jgi:hypothetical protein
MPKAEIEEFAKTLVREVRDRSIIDCDMLLRPQGNSPVAKRWRDKIKDDSSMDLAVTIIADCIDHTLANLLDAIDSGALPVSFVASNGNVVDLTKEGLGELTGWYMGSDGWIAKYSQQRFINDFEDLRDFFDKDS